MTCRKHQTFPGDGKRLKVIFEVKEISWLTV